MLSYLFDKYLFLFRIISRRSLLWPRLYNRAVKVLVRGMFVSATNVCSGRCKKCVLFAALRKLLQQQAQQLHQQEASTVITAKIQRNAVLVVVVVNYCDIL